MGALTEKLASIGRPLTLFVLEWDDFGAFADLASTFIDQRAAPLRIVFRHGTIDDVAEDAARLGTEWIAFRVTPFGRLPHATEQRLVISDLAELREILELRFPAAR